MMGVSGGGMRVSASVAGMGVSGNGATQWFWPPGCIAGRNGGQLQPASITKAGLAIQAAKLGGHRNWCP